MSPEEPVKDWQYLTERATNHLFFVELIKGCEIRTHLPFVCSPSSFVSEMTYTVSSGTLNSTIPYHTITIEFQCTIREIDSFCEIN